MITLPGKLFDKLIAIQVDDKTHEGSIKLPDWKRSLSGIVLSKGPTVASPYLTEGTRVSFGAAKGMEAVYDGKAIRIMKEDDIDLVYLNCLCDNYTLLTCPEHGNYET